MAALSALVATPAHAGFGSLATIPVRPPKFSASGEIAFAAGAQPQTYTAVAKMLVRALERADYRDIRFMPATGGFVVLTSMERIERDGSPADDRWNLDLTPFASNLFKGLFDVVAGGKSRIDRFRVIAFVVSAQSVIPLEQPTLRKEARDVWSSSAELSFPSAIGARPFTERHHIHLLVYEFERSVVLHDDADLVPRSDRVSAILTQAGLECLLRGGGAERCDRN